MSLRDRWLDHSMRIEGLRHEVEAAVADRDELVAEACASTSTAGDRGRDTLTQEASR